MRTHIGFSLGLLLIGGLFAQTRNGQPFVTGTTGSVVHPAGNTATGVFRTTPSVVNPGGGGLHVVVPGQNFRRFGTPGLNFTAYPYPVYIGGYYDTPYISQQAAPLVPDQQLQQQPNIVVIYPPQQQPAAPAMLYPYVPGASTANQDASQQPPQSASDASEAASEPPHYLIAFKDHTIYSAVAYWVDGDTLHYFTSGNTHNQVSLSLIDRDLTVRLNRESGVDMKLGK
ncbi:MAG TPA: hypothetical protein VLY04_19445 [Bryobacteraceae bacterium]|nr:hypothetical protein [Bryobacteraceae bacterium]